MSPGGITNLHGDRAVDRFHVICAWCKQVMEEAPGCPVSHGICEPCRVVNFPESLDDSAPVEPQPWEQA